MNLEEQISSLESKIKEKEGSLEKWDVFLVKHWLIEIEKLKRKFQELKFKN